MSRAVFVLSLPRSGSSAVAGALHRMGVDMGEGHLQVPDASNAGGYYEDLRWQRVNKQLAGYRYSTRRVWTLPETQRAAYRDLAERCAQAADVWGVKGPRLAFTFHLVHPIVAEVAEVQVVVVRRAWDEVRDSLIRHSQVAYGGGLRMAQHEAERLLRNWENALVYSVDSFPGPKHAIEYGELMGEGQEAVLYDLERFCFRGMGHLSLGIAPALEWLDPGMRHHRQGVGV